MLPSLAGAESLVNTTKPNVQHQAATATSSNGSSVVVWTEVKSKTDRDIKAQRFDTAGRKVGAEIVVATGRTPQHSANVAMDARGNFVVVWMHDWSSTDKDIHGALFNANGTRRGGEFHVASTHKNEYDPSVAMASNGNFVVSYTYQFGSTDTDIKAILFRSDGSVARTIDVATSSRREEKSSVSAADDGRFAVVYQSNDNVHLARFSSAGVRAGTHVVAATARAERLADVAMDNSGNATLVWQELNGSQWNIVGRTVSAGGLVGSTFTVATGTAQETLPSIAVDSSTGKSVVAYQTQSGSSTSVMVTELSASRTVIRSATVGTGLADPFVSLGGSAHRYLVAAHSLGGRGLDPDGGIFARFGIL